MVRADALILGTMWQPDLDDGPQLKPPSPVPEGIELVEYAGDFDRAACPDSFVAHLVDGAVVWTDPRTMDDHRSSKAAAIASCCTDAILAGFVSSALGAPHTYPAKPNDQINLTGLVMRSFYPNVGPDWIRPFWCMDAARVWAYRMHTAAQIQQVGDASIDANLTQRGINEQLQAQIIAAETPADLADITWPA